MKVKCDFCRVVFNPITVIKDGDRRYCREYCQERDIGWERREKQEAENGKTQAG